MKYEWRKQEKELYFPKNIPSVADIPTMKFFTISGKGNPNGEAFKERVEALYALAYAIRMMPKKGTTPKGYFEYTVFPLEGVWDVDAEATLTQQLDKNQFVYTLMIRQPDFVIEELFIQAKAIAQKKVAEELLRDICFLESKEGLCVQCMHIGSYDDESETFAEMEAYCEKEGLKRKDRRHREIYLNDPRKTSAEKLKTVLRFQVD